MKTIKEQLLRDPDVSPTKGVLSNALGEANNSYIDFTKELTSHDIHLEWRYYKDGKAWLAKGLYRWTGVRGGKNEKTLFWLSIWRGFFKITIYFPEKSRSDLLCLPLDEEVKLMIVNSKQMGKLNYFPLVFDLYSNKRLETVLFLADFRKSIK